MNKIGTSRYPRSGFTMLEMVMVIVVIGILASLALPRFSRDRTLEASRNILEAIRYTQHLALMDDKIDIDDSNWQRKLWKISFVVSGDRSYYTISSDRDEDGLVDKNETAPDPVNGKYMYHLNTNPVAADESENVLIGKKYGVVNIDFKGGCANIHHIAFDRMGRPFVRIGSASNDYAKYMTGDCIIVFGVSGAKDFNITITKETGYAYRTIAN